MPTPFPGMDPYVEHPGRWLDVHNGLAVVSPMAVDTRGQNVVSHYRILISRAEHRPRAVLLPFNVRHPIPTFRLPLQPGDDEPLVDVNHLLHHQPPRLDWGPLTADAVRLHQAGPGCTGPQWCGSSVTGVTALLVHMLTLYSGASPEA